MQCCFVTHLTFIKPCSCIYWISCSPILPFDSISMDCAARALKASSGILSMCQFCFRHSEFHLFLSKLSRIFGSWSRCPCICNSVMSLDARDLLFERILISFVGTVSVTQEANGSFCDSSHFIQWTLFCAFFFIYPADICLYFHGLLHLSVVSYTRIMCTYLNW